MEKSRLNKHRTLIQTLAIDKSITSRWPIQISLHDLNHIWHSIEVNLKEHFPVCRKTKLENTKVAPWHTEA